MYEDRESNDDLVLTSIKKFVLIITIIAKTVNIC